jgi:DNA-binding transcriptional MerR regulator
VAEPTPQTPRRPLLKSAEVCDLVKVQPYVLRSWEKEFPDLGVAKTAGGPRLYRQADVEQALRIKHLVFSEGLTLAGARRRLDEERASASELPFEDDEPAEASPVAAEARERIEGLKHGLRSLLDLLGQPVTSRAAASEPANGQPARAAPGPVAGASAEVTDDTPAAPRRKGARRRTTNSAAAE